jgi:hypothetical protein
MEVLEQCVNLFMYGIGIASSMRSAFPPAKLEAFTVRFGVHQKIPGCVALQAGVLLGYVGNDGDYHATKSGS